MSGVAYAEAYLSGSHKVAGETYLRELSSDPCKLASIGILLPASLPSLVLLFSLFPPPLPSIIKNNRQHLFVCLFYSGFHCVACWLGTCYINQLLLNSERCPAFASGMLGLKECAFNAQLRIEFFF